MEADEPDVITALPQPIIEIILCLLPIEEAARTSVLSREWRYKWTTIPKLVFDYTTVKGSPEEIGGMELEIARKNKDITSELYEKTCDLVYAMGKCKFFYAVHQVLLQRKAPIFDFTLSMDACFEIDQIICHLSRNHPVERLTLELEETHLGDIYEVPLSFFSFHHLTDLYMKYCEIRHVPISNGFGSLASLTLNRVSISMESLQRLLSSCPSLKSLRLLVGEALEGSFFIMELLKCLPVNIEDLTTWGRLISWVKLESVTVPQDPPTSLINLRSFRCEEMSFDDTGGLTFLAVLMKCSRNLERIEIEIDEDSGKLEEYPVILDEYSDVWLEHLSELDIEDFRDIKPGFELELVKFILARSPNLKEVNMRTDMSDKNEELEMLEVLLSYPRASPVVEIDVYNSCIHHSDDDLMVQLS